MIRRSWTLLLITSLVAAVFAGCLQNNPPSADEEPQFALSRAHVVDLNPDRVEDFDDADTPEAFVRNLVDTTLVVRVGSPGAYTLSFTDESGNERTEVLADLLPGRPHEVRGADPLGFAQLKDATGKVVASRDPVSAAWWAAGEVPLGVTASAPSAATYAYRMDSSMELTLSDVDSEDGSAHLDTLQARFSLPVKGEVRWDLSDDGSEDRLDLGGMLQIDDSRGSIASFEAVGSIEGKQGTVGMEVLSGDAAVEGDATLWLLDGRLSAGQFQGGRAHAAPEIIAWAHGPAFDEMPEGEGFPCAGSTREDRCEPEEIPSGDETMEAQPKEVFDADEFSIPEEDKEEVLAFMQKVLSQDLQLYDSLVLTATFDSEDMGAPANSQFSTQFTNEISVPVKERIAIAAGEFEALRVVQTSRLVANVGAFNDETCVYPEYSDEPAYDPSSPYPTQPPSYPSCEMQTRTYLENLNLDETLTRTTLWLDAESFQPLKATVETPVDLDKLLHEVLEAAGDDLWGEFEVSSFDPANLRLTTTASSTLEATKITGNARFSPLVGFLLGSLLGNGGLMGGSAASAFGAGMGGGAYAEPVPIETYEPRSLSLVSEGPLDGGLKRYTVSSATSGMSWSDVQIAVNGETWMYDFEGACQPASANAWTACQGETWKSQWEMAEAGDTLTLNGVASGDTLRVIDVYSNSVILTMVVS